MTSIAIGMAALRTAALRIYDLYDRTGVRPETRGAGART